MPQPLENDAKSGIRFAKRILLEFRVTCNYMSRALLSKSDRDYLSESIGLELAAIRLSHRAEKLGAPRLALRALSGVYGDYATHARKRLQADSKIKDTPPSP
jgi:hypothetical protein